MSQQNQVVIQGNGVVTAGQYDKVVIMGMGEVVGVVTTKDASFMGNVSVKEQLKFGKMKSDGICDCDNLLEGDELRLKGIMTMRGEVRVRRIHAVGKVRAEKGIRGDTMEAEGFLRISGGIECERVELKGKIQVSGLLNANQVTIAFDENSEIEEIGGEHINIRHEAKRRRWFILRMPRDVTLKADSIEGNRISIEYTHANVVRGEHVVIGPKCRIDRVEYVNSLKVSPDAVVGQQEKIQM
jgi:cytoskeletal protein CcmA (bactofilin family)